MKPNIKCKKLFFLSLCVLSIIVSLLTFYFSLKIYFSTDHYNLWYFENIRQSWISGPIYAMDQRIASCDNNYNNLINQKWELTFEGCGYDFFQNCSYFNDGLSSLILGDAIEFPKNLNITRWKKNHYCIKRLNYNYFNMTLVDEKRDCPANYKKCGVIDSFENYLCVLTSENCPLIVDQLIKAFQFKTNFTLKEDENNQMKYYDIRSKDYRNYVITETFIRRNPVCFSYSTKIRDIVQKPYFRFEFPHECSKLNVTDNLKVFDERIFLLDYYDIDQVYHENSIYLELLRNSTDIAEDLAKISYNIKGFLFSKNYPGINLKCMQNPSSPLVQTTNSTKNNFLFTEKDLISIQSVQAFLFCEFISILFNGVSILTEIIIFYYNWMGARERLDEMFDLKHTLSNYKALKQGLVISFFFLVFITTLVNSVYYYWLSKAIYEIISLFGNPACVDKYTYILLQETCKDLFIKRDNYSAPLIFSATYILLYIFTHICSNRTLMIIDKNYEKIRNRSGMFKFDHVSEKGMEALEADK